MDAIPSPRSKSNQNLSPSKYLNFSKDEKNPEFENNRLNIDNSERKRSNRSNRSNKSSRSRRSKKSKCSKSSSKNLNKSANHSSKMIVVKPMQISISKEHENTRLNVHSQKKSKTKIEKKFVNPFRITNPDKEQIEQEYYSQIWDNDKKSEYGDILGRKYQHKMSNGSEIRAHNHALDINKSVFGNFRNSVHEKTGKFFQLPLSQKKL